jgi:hypothetical protein
VPSPSALQARRLRALLVAASAATSAFACAQPSKMGGGGLEEPREMRAPVGRNRDVITEPELNDPNYRTQNAMEVVRSLRPHFLTARGKNSHSDNEAGLVHISVDNGRILPADELRNVLAMNIKEIRFLSVAAAMQKFGGAAREGPVILVSMK